MTLVVKLEIYRDCYNHVCHTHWSPISSSREAIKQAWKTCLNLLFRGVLGLRTSHVVGIRDELLLCL